MPAGDAIPGHVLIPLKSSKTLFPIFFLQSYSTIIQLHFSGGIVFFPLSFLLCLLWARKSLAQSCKRRHSPALSRVRQHRMHFFHEAPQGNETVCLGNAFMSPDTGPEKAGTNGTCKVTKACGMAAHKVMVQTWVLHSSCVSAFRKGKEKERLLLSLMKFTSWRKCHHENMLKVTSKNSMSGNYFLLGLVCLVGWFYLDKHDFEAINAWYHTCQGTSNNRCMTEAPGGLLLECQKCITELQHSKHSEKKNPWIRQFCQAGEIRY